MAWGREPGEAAAGAWSTRTTGGRPRRRGSCGPWATRGARFEEDALRMIRAVRLAATLDFAIEPATRPAIGARSA